MTLDGLLKPPRTDHQKHQAMISVPPPQSPGRREGAGNGVNDGSCLHDQASIKIPEVQGLESSRLVNTCMYLKGNATPTPVLRISLPPGLTYLSLLLAIHLYPLSYLLINW